MENSNKAFLASEGKKTKYKRMLRSQRFRKDVKNQGHQGLEWLPNIYPGEGNGLRENKPIIQVARNPPLPLPQFFDGMTKRLPKERKTKNLTFVI